MMRYTDENNRRFPTNRPTGAAFFSKEEIKEQSRKTMEREIVKLIAKEFRLNLRVIGEAVKNETTVFDYLLLGLHQAYTPQFPATIQIAKPQRGKGQVFTLNRLLHHPEKYSLVGHFIALQCQNLHRTFRPAMLVGNHPRLGLLAVTDLKMEPDILCFQFSVAQTRGNKTLLLAEIKHLLRAIHRQGIWLPEAR